MFDILEISKKIWCWIKWPVYIVAGIFIFLGITQLVECFGVDASNKFAMIFTPLIVAAVTIYLSNRQHNIADAQRAVAEESKNIAASNRDIAQMNSQISLDSKKIALRKLKLELFDKRYAAFILVKRGYILMDSTTFLVNELFSPFSSLSGSPKSLLEDIQKFLELRKKYESLEKYLSEYEVNVNQSEFLFDKNVYDTCSYFLDEIDVFTRSIQLFIENGTTSYYDIFLSQSNYVEIKEIYHSLEEKMNPYLSLDGIA